MDFLGGAQGGLFMGVFRVFKGGVSLSKVAACS